MKNLLIIITLVLIFGSSLHSESYHFVANDPYYKVSVKIDSINVYYMNTGKDTTIISSSVHMGTVTTVELNEEHNDVQLYPNPANDHLNIEFISESISSTPISIVDLEGRKLYSQSEKFGIGKHNLNLNIAGLNQGHYFITIGKSTYKFSKMGSTNGSEISLTQTTMPTLIKENSTQSQYDYKFTIYCEGFKPKYFYSKQTERETIVVDLVPKPHGFDAKGINFELFLSKAVFSNSHSDHNPPNVSYSTSTLDFTIRFQDTLAFRNGQVKNKRSIQLYPIKRKYTSDSYDTLNLEFTVDTVNKTISHILMTRKQLKGEERDFIYTYLEDQFSHGFVYNGTSGYKLIDNKLVFIMYLDQIESEVWRSSKSVEFYEASCSGHISSSSLQSYNPSKSYIKIEFID